MTQVKPPTEEWLKKLILGGARSVNDRRVFHHLSLIAFFAWVGLGADGLSSSSYGPQESYGELGSHHALGIFVALATGVTICIISASYSQIIELFPSGGGGYLVASKLLTPRLGAVAGCALLVDYVLTIAVSIASGADTLFSFLPEQYLHWKLAFKISLVLVMMVLNLRGVKESVAPLVPIFIVFVITHAFVIVYAIATHLGGVGQVAQSAVQEARQLTATPGYGFIGLMILVLHSYSMGAGTYTGIEAVSNGLPILREPRVQTGKRTMTYMWISLAVTVVGLMVAYLLYNIHYDKNTTSKTINALLLENMTSGWGLPGTILLWVTLASETALLVAAAQTGLLGGPRVLANMATDRWFPTRLSMLSDRLVTQNGVLLMSLAALVTMMATGGSVSYLVTLYAINVFITFVLSQTGMVRHWWMVRHETPTWRRKLTINGIGLILCVFILVWNVAFKFWDGGWVTLVVTTALVVLVSLINRYYRNAGKMVQQLDRLAQSAKLMPSRGDAAAQPPVVYERDAKTAILLVSGYNGLGVHAVLNILRFFGSTFKNFAFISVGVVDAGNFKGSAEVSRLREHVEGESRKYVDLMNQHGYYSESFTAVGNDVVDEVEKLAPEILSRFPQAVFFAGQMIFPKESMFTRLLHNNIVFAVQRRLYRQGIPFVILPVRV